MRRQIKVHPANAFGEMNLLDVVRLQLLPGHFFMIVLEFQSNMVRLQYSVK